MVEILVTLYVGGIAALIVNELANDGVQVADILATVLWPITAASTLITKVKGLTSK